MAKDDLLNVYGCYNGDLKGDEQLFREFYHANS